MYLRILPVITIPVLLTINLPPEPPKPLPEPIPIVEIAPPPPPKTWRDNPQGCDEATQYIAEEEPFYCISKPVAPKAQVAPVRTPQNGSSGLNGYVLTSCTGYVASRRYVPSGLGNATTWFSRASSLGLTTGTEPRVGAIGWTYGHVTFIEKVEGSRVYLSEKNYDYRGSYRERWADASSMKYIY